MYGRSYVWIPAPCSPGRSPSDSSPIPWIAVTVVQPASRLYSTRVFPMQPVRTTAAAIPTKSNPVRKVFAFLIDFSKITFSPQRGSIDVCRVLDGFQGRNGMWHKYGATAIFAGWRNPTRYRSTGYQVLKTPTFESSGELTSKLSSDS